jgi:hypothetical protein
MRTIFGPKRDEVTGEWRRLQNVEHNDLSFLSNIIWLMKWRRMRWGEVARMGERRGVSRVQEENLRERETLEDPGVYGRIILRRIFRKWVGGTDWIDLAQERDRLLSLVNVVVKLQVL